MIAELVVFWALLCLLPHPTLTTTGLSFPLDLELQQGRSKAVSHGCIPNTNTQQRTVQWMEVVEEAQSHTLVDIGGIHTSQDSQLWSPRNLTHTQQ